MTKYCLRALLLAALLAGNVACAKSGSAGEKKGLRNMRAGAQTGSNLQRKVDVAPDDEVKPKKKKKSAPTEDRDYLPRGGFR